MINYYVLSDILNSKQKVESKILTFRYSEMEELKTNCFKVIRELTKYYNEIKSDLSNAYSTYYSNLRYFRKCGGVFPTYQKVSELKSLLSDVFNLRKYLCEEVDYIKLHKCARKEFIEHINDLVSIINHC